MLLYNQVYDPYHTLLRMLKICMTVQNKYVEYDRLRIYDFLMVFPSQLTLIRLSNGLKSKKKVFETYINPYNNFDSKMAFNNMQVIQDAVIMHLEKMQILYRHEEYNSNDFTIQVKFIPEHLAKIVANTISIDIHVLEFICYELKDIPLLGKNGLKDRTEILEFKYDAI